jgi:general secretion pathway protein G
MAPTASRAATARIGISPTERIVSAVQPWWRRGPVIVSVAGLAIIVAAALVFAGPSFFRSEEMEGREANIWLDNLASRIELYRSTTGRYPATLRDLVGPYIRETELKDHWGNPYVYKVPGTEGRPFDLTTLGADGKPGGEGRDRDRTWKAR